MANSFAGLFRSVQALPESDRFKYCQEQESPEDLRKCIGSSNNLILFLKSLLPEKDRFKFCKLLGEEHLKKLPAIEKNSLALLESVQQAHRLNLCDFFDVKSFRVENIASILKIIFPTPDLISTPEILLKVLSWIPLEDRITFFSKLLNKKLCDTLLLQSESENDQLLELLLESFDNFIELLPGLLQSKLQPDLYQKKIGNDFKNLYAAVAQVEIGSPDLQQKFLDSFDTQYLQSTIRNIDNLNLLLFRLKQTNRLQLCELLGRDFVAPLICSYQTFEHLLWRFNKNKNEFLEWLIPTAQDLATLLSQLPSNDRINCCRLLDLSFLEKLMGDALSLSQEDILEFCERLDIDTFHDHNLLSTLFKKANNENSNGENIQKLEVEIRVNASKFVQHC